VVVASRQYMNRQLDKAVRSNARKPASDAGEPGGRIRVYRGITGLQQIASDWSAVADRQFRQRFFHWHAWFEAWLGALETEPDAVRFFVVCRDDAPVAIVPLKSARRRVLGMPVRSLRLPRHAHLPMGDMICAAGVDPADVLHELGAFLSAEGEAWDVIEFAPLLEESPTVAALPNLPGIVHVTREKTCDQLECAGDFDTIKAKFSKNFRSNLNKARNKLAKRENVRMSSVSGHGQLQSAFEDFLALEASGWKGAAGAGTAIALHPELINFYQALIDKLANRVVINSLHVDGELIAAQFCVRDNDTLYILKLSYDEGHARLAPGNMLLEQVIEQGIASGEWRYINLVGDPPWFKAWMPESQGMFSVRLCNRSIGGVGLWLALCAKSRLAPLYRWYREKLRNRRQSPR
jgi:CelD/BcsL family acetyltransferase involved in cellulose biosynthesis